MTSEHAQDRFEDRFQDRVDVLLVEDNAYDAALALRAFRKERPGTRLQVVRDGAEAVSFLLGDEPSGSEGQRTRGLDPNQMPRLVLLDLNLPKLNGLEVLERLRADARTKHLTIVVMTSSREERDVTRAYALGANSYVVKPLEYDKFAELVREIVGYWLDHNQAAVPR